MRWGQEGEKWESVVGVENESSPMTHMYRKAEEANILYHIFLSLNVSIEEKRF